MIERLFDIVKERSQKAPNAIMLAAKENGAWRTYSGGEVWETAGKLAGGLLTLSIANSVLEPDQQEKIAIISPNRPEWVITDIGVQLTGAVLTPIYPTISPDEIIYVLNEAGVQILFVANADIYGRFNDAFTKVPTLRNVFSFDVIEAVANWKELVNKNAGPDQSLMARIKGET